MEDEERGTENGEREFRVILVNIQFDGWIGGVNMRSKASFTLSRTKYDWIEKPKVALCGLLCILDINIWMTDNNWPRLLCFEEVYFQIYFQMS